MTETEAATTGTPRTRTGLTRVQAEYLRAIGCRAYLQYGQGGYTSTRTVRTLQAMGLIMVNPRAPRPGGWSAAITEDGRKLLEGGNS